MDSMKFGALLTPGLTDQSNLITDHLALESHVKTVILLEELGYDEVWLLEGAENSHADSTDFQKTIQEVSRATRTIKLGIGILPTDISESMISKVQLVRQRNKKTPLKFAIASQVSPSSIQIASTQIDGNQGLGILSIAATTPAGFNALPSHWEIYTRKMREWDHPTDRSDWSLVGPTHLAKTSKQAMLQVQSGAAKWLQQYAAMGLVPFALGGADPISAMSDSGFATIGTPRTAIAQIRRLQDQTGGFGTFLLPINNWAALANTHTSLELFAKHVFPRFRSMGQK